MSDQQTGSISLSQPITGILANHNYSPATGYLANNYNSLFFNSYQQQQNPMSLLQYAPVQSNVGSYAEQLKVNPVQQPNPSININIPSDINQYGQKLFKGGTSYDWASMGINTAFNIWNAYNQYQALKQSQQNFEEQKRLNHANYQMTAKAYNRNLRNQLSGRGYVGMTGAAVRELGKDYNQSKANKDY